MGVACEVRACHAGVGMHARAVGVRTHFCQDVPRCITKVGAAQVLDTARWHRVSAVASDI